MQNVINLVLDLKNKNYNYIVIQQNDDVVIEAELYDNGIPVNLSNHTVIANFTAANDAFINIAGSKITKNNNKTTIVCEKYFSQSVGNATGQITLVDATSKQASTFPFKIKVNKGIINNPTVCNNAATILKDISNAATSAAQSVQNIKDAEVTYPNTSTLAKRVQLHGTQINDINSLINGIDSVLVAKRNKTDKFTANDFDTSTDTNKIQLKNLSQEVLQAMAGTTSIEATVADGAVTKEKLAQGVLGTEYEGVLKLIKGNVVSRAGTSITDFIIDHMELARYDDDSLKYNIPSTVSFAAINSNLLPNVYNTMQFTVPDTPTTDNYLCFGYDGTYYYGLHLGINSIVSCGYITKFTDSTSKNVVQLSTNSSVVAGDIVEITFDLENKILNANKINSIGKINICSFKYSEYLTDSQLRFGFISSDINWGIRYKKIRFQNVNLNTQASYLKARYALKENPIKGLTYCSVGDSITWLDGNTEVSTGLTVKGYQSYVKEELHCDVVNAGKSGWSTVNMCNQYLNGGESDTYKSTINSADFITVMSGTNDFQNNSPIGEVGSKDVTTFCGALYVLLREIIKANPTKKIMYINQPYRRGYRINDGEDYSTQQYNALNVYFKDYMEKGIEVAKLLNIPTLNLYNECGWNEYNVENLTVDGLHPNTTYGYKSIGGIITRFIKNNI